MFGIRERDTGISGIRERDTGMPGIRERDAGMPGIRERDADVLPHIHLTMLAGIISDYPFALNVSPWHFEARIGPSAPGSQERTCAGRNACVFGLGQVDPAPLPRGSCEMRRFLWQNAWRRLSSHYRLMVLARYLVGFGRLTWPQSSKIPLFLLCLTPPLKEFVVSPVRGVSPGSFPFQGRQTPLTGLTTNEARLLAPSQNH